MAFEWSLIIHVLLAADATHILHRSLVRGTMLSFSMPRLHVYDVFFQGFKQYHIVNALLSPHRGRCREVIRVGNTDLQKVARFNI